MSHTSGQPIAQPSANPETSVTTFPTVFDQCLLNDAVILDKEIVEHTTSMILKVILRPWLFVLFGVSTRDLPAQQSCALLTEAT